MFRVMVAEDELPLLRGLSRLIQRLDPRFEVVFQAKNGKEALEHLSQHDVDVLFTDINMPVVNGLELMERARQLDPSLLVVVISGYNDFEYARKALQVGAKNYLLKPIDRQELQTFLTELAQEMQRCASAQKRSALAECLFCGDAAPLGKCTWAPLMVMALCLGPCTHTGDELPKLGALSDGKMWEMIHQEWQCENFWLFFGQKPNEAVWIFESEPPVSLTALQQLLQRRFGEEVFVTAAVAAGVLPSSLPACLAQLTAWISNGAVLWRSRLLKSAPAARRMGLSIADRSSLCLAVQKQQWDEFSLQIQRLLPVLYPGDVTQREIESYLQTLLELVIQVVHPTEKQDPRAVVQELVSTSSGYGQLWGAFLHYCRDLSQGTAFDTGNKQVLMEAVEQYILQHISEPLSLQTLSQKFGLVAPYLSKLFKAYKGMSPAQYVQYVRIENAKRMLRENPAMLSRQIAEALGYSNPLYFSKTFYKHVGMYPSEYRIQHKQE